MEGLDAREFGQFIGGNSSFLGNYASWHSEQGRNGIFVALQQVHSFRFCLEKILGRENKIDLIIEM